MPQAYIIRVSVLHSAKRNFTNSQSGFISSINCPQGIYKGGEKISVEKEKQLNEAILKVALGFQVSETVEEYAEVDGELKLTKRKCTQKDVPPDLKAVQLLIDSGTGADVANMSDEELEAEKARLLGVLADQKKTVKKVVKTPKDVGQVCDETPKKPRKPRAKPRKRK